MLAEVFDSDGLILCELADRGILDNLPPEDLAELFSWFSFDREFRYGNRFVLPDRLVLARRRIEDVEHAVLSEERGEGLAIKRGTTPISMAVPAHGRVAPPWPRSARRSSSQKAI